MEINKLKTCVCCKTDKPIENFTNKKEEIHYYCHDCRRTKARQYTDKWRAKEKNKRKIKVYYKKNKEVLKLNSKEYYQNNKEECLNYRKDRYYKDVCDSRKYYRDYMSEYRKTPKGRKKVKETVDRYKRKNPRKHNHRLISIRECYAGNKYSTKIIADKEKLIEEINSLLQLGMNKDNFKTDWTIREDKEGKLYTQWKRKCLE